MASDLPFEIATMQPWMIPGMAQLQALEYGVEPAAAETKIRNWFDSDFARRRGSIVLVGVSAERVIAVQSYSPWPYLRNGREYRSLQSGATLVHPQFRGRKIFQRMLVEGNRIATDRGADFFVGFPVQASYGGFIKDNWVDLGRLRWWIRPLRPLALVRRTKSGTVAPTTLRTGDPLTAEPFRSFEVDGERFQLTTEREFLEWRYRGRAPEVRYFERVRGRQRVGVAVKLSVKHGFDEMLIGKIRRQNAGTAFVTQALLSLARSAYRDGVAALSTALLEPTPATVAALVLSGFVPAKSTTPLIVRPLRALPEVADRSLWRGTCFEDIDTW